jgi:DNA-binding response OmpR family regulator
VAKASESKKRLLRALVAEDDPGMRQLIVGIMELDGWDVREAVDGDEAVTIAGVWHPDAVVIDVVMPNKDGLTAVREIRELDGGRHVGVVVVATTAALEHEARSAGSDHFMVAPLDASELSARARAAHRWRRSRDRAAAPSPADGTGGGDEDGISPR